MVFVERAYDGKNHQGECDTEKGFCRETFPQENPRSQNKSAAEKEAEMQDLVEVRNLWSPVR
jgi:hypothetical protein